MCCHTLSTVNAYGGGNSTACQDRVQTEAMRAQTAVSGIDTGAHAAAEAVKFPVLTRVWRRKQSAQRDADTARSRAAGSGGGPGLALPRRRDLDEMVMDCFIAVTRYVAKYQ